MAQNAIFALYEKIAKCKYLQMSNRSCSSTGVPGARPWLTRRSGECAYPVHGVGRRVWSCCRPAGPSGYCEAHRRRMVEPSAASFRDFEKEVLSFLARQ